MLADRFYSTRIVICYKPLSFKFYTTRKQFIKVPEVVYNFVRLFFILLFFFFLIIFPLGLFPFILSVGPLQPREVLTIKLFLVHKSARGWFMSVTDPPFASVLIMSHTLVDLGSWNLSPIKLLLSKGKRLFLPTERNKTIPLYYLVAVFIRL